MDTNRSTHHQVLKSRSRSQKTALPGSRSHPEAEDFAINFSRDELQALEVFNKAFRDQVQGLPSSEGTVRSWHVSPQWQEVMSSAKSALIVLLPSTPAKP
jgi:hypothetical protein